MKPASNQHLIALDFVRFFSAMLVVIYHLGVVAWSYPSLAQQVVDAPIVQSPAWAWGWFGFVGVQVFFVISGFVIAYSAQRGNAWKFARDRVLRLAPALWIGAVLSLAVYLAADLISPVAAFKLFIKQIIFYPFGPWLDVVVWTLGIEIAFYAAVFGMMLAGRLKWLPALGALLAVISTTYNIAQTVAPCAAGQAEWYCLLTGPEFRRVKELLLLPHGVFFAIGIFFWLWLVEHRPQRHWHWFLIAILGSYLQIRDVALLNMQALWSHDRLYSPGFGVIVAFSVWSLFTAGLVVGVKYNDRLLAAMSNRVRFVRLLGLATYPLYLTHMMTGAAFIALFYKSGVPFWPAIFVGTLLVVVLNLVIAQSLEPPVRKFLRSLFDQLQRLAVVKLNPR